MSDPFDLHRFVQAQAPVIDDARRELRAGRKTSHWMWFVFPQIAGLGRSETARRFAIASRQEATAYFAHDVLGPRLVECTKLVLGHEGHSSVEAIFGYPDYLKFQSCMTLFARCSVGEGAFEAALRAFFAGQGDEGTLARLAAGS